jgi:serine/threonine protein kinase
MPGQHSKPDSLDADATRAGDLNDVASSDASLGDLETNVDLSTDLSDLSEFSGATDEAGEVVDLSKRYEIIDTLGRGGMGEVVRACDRRLDRSVAIKRLRREFGKSQTAFRRFLTEAKSVAALNHFNIVQIHDFGQDSEGPFIVMELVEGQSLAERLESGLIPVEEAIDLTSQICDALQVAHDRGIVHRDIKPANILLNEAGIPKLTDFGLARQESSGASTQTQAGTVLGTLDFMPPEQRKDASQADGRSDQWSLAATFYQMITGELPRVIDGGAIPESIREVTLRALKTTPADRFESISEFGHSLQNSEGSNPKRDVSRLQEGQCTGCGVINDRSRKFCNDCGASLKEPCPSCAAPTAVWERFCGECGVDIQSIIQSQIEDAQILKSEVKSLRTTFRHNEALAKLDTLLTSDHSSLQDQRDWADALRTKLQGELAKLESQREQLLTAAQEQADEGKTQAALKYLNQIPEPLQTEQSIVLCTRLNEEIEEAKKLAKEIQQALKERRFTAFHGT